MACARSFRKSPIHVVQISLAPIRPVPTQLVELVLGVFTPYALVKTWTTFGEGVGFPRKRSTSQTLRFVS